MTYFETKRLQELKKEKAFEEKIAAFVILPNNLKICFVM